MPYGCSRRLAAQFVPALGRVGGREAQDVATGARGWDPLGRRAWRSLLGRPGQAIGCQRRAVALIPDSHRPRHARMRGITKIDADFHLLDAAAYNSHA
jgi:hypothetical protein